MIDLTILVVNYETCDLLERCLDSIARACRAHPRLDVETILIDNHSRDGSIEVALASSVAPRVVALARNRGFAAAVNHGLLLRRGRHLLLLNSDVEIEEDVLLRGVEVLDDSTDVGVLGIALVHPDGRPQRCVHAFPSLQTELIPEFILRRIRPGGYSRLTVPTRQDRDSGPREVEAVRGAVFFIRGELLEKVGLFDAGYFFFLEETDYCWRVRAAGYGVVHWQALHAMHQLGASGKRRVPLATRIEFHRSLYRFLDRRRGARVASIVRTSRIVRNAITVLGLLIFGLGSDRSRSRLSERWGLLLWHFRGRPSEPNLAQALRVAIDSDV